MRDTWKSIHKVWALLKPPMRPNPEVVEAVAREIAGCDDIELAGVTAPVARDDRVASRFERRGGAIFCLASVLHIQRSTPRL